MLRAILSPRLPLAAPVEPEADEARELIIRELSKPEYREAQPTWLDRIAAGFLEWLGSLEFSISEGGEGLGLLLVALVVAAVLVAAFFIFGRPALSRRSRVTGVLFGDDDDRDATTLRRDAERHASAGRWDEALLDMFRSIARGLAERTIVMSLPGTTAQDFAQRAGLPFADHALALRASADDFDAVRYLGQDGTREQFERVAALEGRLRAARPELAETAGSGAPA